MNCNDVAAILDSNRSARMTAAERATVDEHLSGCDDCDAAWHAQTELLALRVPPMPATLLERALLTGRVPPVTKPRRAWRPIAIGTTLLAGAALAGIAVVSLTAPPSADTAAAPIGEPAAPAGEASIATAASAPARPTQKGSLATSVELVNTSLQVVPFVRIAPVYPPDALAVNLEGNVTIEFTVTATGEVEDAHVAESTDARLDAAALRAVEQWKYLPRIVAGKRAATEDVRTRITFQTQMPAQAAIQRASEPTGPGLPPDAAAFEVTMMTAWQRVIADDLRGAELALDEFGATYALPAFTEGEVWNAYAYVYTLQANYDRAIDAYEAAIAVFARAGRPTQGRWVELANLYFARNQYDMALKTLLRPPRGTGAERRPYTPEAEALLEKLRALGVTEETVSAR